jgi:hypothetical protein
MTTPDLERRIRTWFADEIGETETAPSSVYAFLGSIPESIPWERRLFGRRTFVLLAATFLLAVLLGGAIAVGTGVVKLPSILPPNPSLVEASAEATPSMSVEPSPAQPLGLIAYSVIQPIDPPPDGCETSLGHPWCYAERIWVANSDGSGAHQLLPDVPGRNQHVIAWTPDGARLLYADDRGLALTDVRGSEPEIITSTLCPAGTVTNCPNLEGFLSPDGTRLAYTIFQGSQANSSIVAIFDLATREITLLESTRTTGLNLSCVTAANQGVNEFPRWSPDGTRLVVTRQAMGPLDQGGACRSIVLTVNPDGTDLRVVVPSDGQHEPLNASWSPDGTQIVFHRSVYSGGADEGTCDVATIRSDGSNLRQLTSDGVSCQPRWTQDGRILFGKWIDLDRETYDLWIMDADGNNARRLTDTSLSALTDIGCVVCPNPGETWSDVLWQPTP